MNVRDFKSIFKQLRKERGYTQNDISKNLNVSKSSVAMWETGHRLPSPELYEQIADFFNVDIDYLYGRSDIRQAVRFDEDGNPQYTLSPDEVSLLDSYNKLNDTGKQEARKRVQELAEIERYQKGLSASSEEKVG